MRAVWACIRTTNERAHCSRKRRRAATATQLPGSAYSTRTAPALLATVTRPSSGTRPPLNEATSLLSRRSNASVGRLRPADRNKRRPASEYYPGEFDAAFYPGNTRRMEKTFAAFAGDKLIAAGALEAVLSKVKHKLDKDDIEQLLIFDEQN